MLNTRDWPEIAAARLRRGHASAIASSDDGQAALEWLGSYLDRLRDLPVLSQVEPGDVRGALPSTAPPEPEPFAACSPTSSASSSQGSRTGRARGTSPTSRRVHASPRSWPSSSPPGSTRSGILWRTSPALQELEELTLDWLRELLGLPDGLHGHIEDSASSSTLSALAAARSAAPGRRVVVCSEHAHSSVEKAARLLELELRKMPADAEHRLRADLLDLTGACAVVATIGTTSSAAIDPVPAIADACERGRRLAPRRRRLRGLGGGLPRAAAALRRLGARRLDRGQPAQVARHPDGLLGQRGHVGSRTTAARSASCPSTCARRDDAVSLSEVAFPLGRRFRALKLWAVLRCLGASGLQTHIRSGVRLAEVFEQLGPQRVGLGARGTAELLASSASASTGSDAANEELMERVNRSGEIFLSHTKLGGRLVLRLAIGNYRTTEADVRLAFDVLRREAAAL